MLELTIEDIKLLNEAVEFDLVRYDNNDMYAPLLELHMNKYKSFITRGRFKTQEELRVSLVEYRDRFKSIAEPNYLLY
jgi:hypothetical protein